MVKTMESTVRINGEPIHTMFSKPDWNCFNIPIEDFRDEFLMGEARGCLEEIQEHPDNINAHEGLEACLEELRKRGYEARTQIVISEYRQVMF
jgi:hypothetical protein